MKFNSYILTQLALTSTLVASGAVSVDAQEAADIYLDTLDADGHLSLLEAETYTAKSEEQKVAAKPKVAETKVAETKVQKITTQAKSKYVEANYSTVEAAHTPKANLHGLENRIKIAAAPKVKVDAHKGEHGASKDHGASKAHGKDHGKGNNSFLTKHTTEIEFTFAILVIVVGLIASERFQRVQEQQVQVTNESGNNDFGQFEES